jgi:hypothetical protein
VLPGSEDFHKVNTLDQKENNKVLDALSGGKNYPKLPKKIHKILSFAVEVTGMDSQDVSLSKVRVSFLNQGVEV